LAVLTRSLVNSTSGKEADPIRDYYETRVFRCDKNGVIKDDQRVLFRREYGDLVEAEAGHKETVNRLFERRLKLKKQNLYQDQDF
jgi:hypothetical protein